MCPSGALKQLKSVILICTRSYLFRFKPYWVIRSFKGIHTNLECRLLHVFTIKNVTFVQSFVCSIRVRNLSHIKLLSYDAERTLKVIATNECTSSASQEKAPTYDGSNFYKAKEYISIHLVYNWMKTNYTI